MSRRVASSPPARAEHHPDLFSSCLACVIMKAISFPRVPCRTGLCLWHAVWVQMVHGLMSRIPPHLLASGNTGCMLGASSSILSTWVTSYLSTDENDGALGMYDSPSASHTDFSGQIFRGSR